MAMWFSSQYLAQASSGQYNHTNPDDLSRGSSMASSQKDLGARPKETGQSQTTYGSAAKQHVKENLTFHGNNREVSLEEGWTTVLCKVTCQNSVNEYCIDQWIPPCKLQYVLTTINYNNPLYMKITVLEPEVLIIDMKYPRSQTNVVTTLQNAVVVGKCIEKAQFSSKDECQDVMLNHLDERSFRLLASSSAKLFYFNKNNTFIVQMVGPYFCSLFKDFTHVSQQIEEGKRRFQQLTGVHSLKQTGQSQMTPGAEANQQVKPKGILTVEGNKRTVTLAEGWNTVTCKVVCTDGSTYSIRDPVDPCILQYETGVDRVQFFESRCKIMKVNSSKPELLNIQLEGYPQTESEVTDIIRKAFERIQKAELQFTSMNECCNVLLNRLDYKRFSLINSTDSKLFYFNNNNSFVVQMIGPVYANSANFQNVARQIEICKKLEDLSASLDSQKQDMEEKHKSLKPEKAERTINCLQQTLSDLETLGILKVLKMPFSYSFKILNGGILFSCMHNSQLDELVKEFDVYVSRLKRIPVDFPVAPGYLFVNANEKRDKFLRQQLKCSEIKFIVEDNDRVTLLCLSQEVHGTILQALSNCYHHTAILNEILDQPMVQLYLEEHQDGVCLLYDDNMRTNVTHLYAMKYVKTRVKMINVDFLPVEAWCFLTNVIKRRDMFSGHVRCEHITFLVADSGIVLLCITKADDQIIYQSLRDCVPSMNIASEILQQPMIQQFLNDNKDDICVCKDIRRRNVTCLYFMKYVREYLEEVQRHYGSRCDVFVSEYLKSQGSNLLSKLEQEHEVKAVLSDNFLEFSGNHEVGSRMMNELESRLHTLVHHEEDAEKCTQIAYSDNFQQKIRQIADKNSCSMKTVPVEIGKKYSGVCKVEGASTLTTWILRDMSNCVSIVCGDIQSMKLDALIIPVNSSLIGEGPLGLGIKPLSDIFRSQSGGSKGKLGEVIEGQFKDNMMCKTGFAVVVSSTEFSGSAERMVTLKNTEMQKSVQNIIGRLKYMGIQCNIGVCVPQDEEEFSIHLNDIIQSLMSASETALGKQFHLYACVKSDRERWIQKINRSGLISLWEQSHRRIVDPDVYGIFTARKDTKVDISATSLLHIGAECLVVSVGNDFNLLHGFVAKQIKESAGPGLQEELDKAWQSNTKKHIIAARPWKLSNIGVKLLVFVVIPHWSKCERSTQKLQVLVEDCLLIVDQYYCKSVAFPVFGIGNLEYPMRDVAVAFYDAIDVFKKQSVFQVISQIYISAPMMKNDDSMLQLLKMEEQRRINIKQTKPCFKQEEIHCLSASNSNVVYKVVTKDNAPLLMSGEYVHVQFDQTRGADEPNMRTLRDWIFQCGRSKEALQQKIEDVVYFCEKDRITSICVSLGSAFRFSESEQIKIVSGAVDKAVHNLGSSYNASMVYKYLKTVLIVVSDAFTFHPEVLASGASASIISSFMGRQIDNVWKVSSHPLAVYGMNMVVIGESTACERTLRDVNNMLTAKDEGNGGDESLYFDAKEDVGVQVQNGKDESEQYVEQHVDEHVDEGVVVNEDENIICDLMDGEVTAELNPGLVQFLTSVDRSAYESWTKWIENTYKIQVESNDSSKLFIRGQLDTITKFENYLENEFTMLDPFGFDEKHFKTVHKPWHEFLVPMLRQEAESILQINSDGIEELDRQMNGSHLKIVENGFLIACSPENEPHIRSKIQMWQAANRKLEKKSEKVKTDFQNTGFVISEALFKYRNVDVAVVCSDIIECDVDCIVSSVNSDMSYRNGIAKQIASKAGQHYMDVCKKGTLKVCECVNITIGSESSLKCQGILNVNCFPSTNFKEVGLIYLNEVRESVTNCFKVAENFEYTSIALPMLRTGQLRLEVPLCAQECFRAIDNGEFKHLKKIIFVAFDLTKVKDFVKVLAFATSPKSDQSVMVSTSLKLKIKSSKTLIHIVNQAVAGPEVTARVEFRGDMKQELKVKKQKLEDRIKHRTEGLLHILKVPEPEDDSDTDIYSTVWCVLQKAKEYKISKIAIPTLVTTDKNWREDENSCKSILQAVCEFCAKHPSAMEYIQIMSPKQEVISTMAQLVLTSI